MRSPSRRIRCGGRDRRRRRDSWCRFCPWPSCRLRLSSGSPRRSRSSCCWCQCRRWCFRACLSKAGGFIFNNRGRLMRRSHGSRPASTCRWHCRACIGWRGGGDSRRRRMAYGVDRRRRISERDQTLARRVVDCCRVGSLAVTAMVSTTIVWNLRHGVAADARSIEAGGAGGISPRLADDQALLERLVDRFFRATRSTGSVFPAGEYEIDADAAVSLIMFVGRNDAPIEVTRARRRSVSIATAGRDCKPSICAPIRRFDAPPALRSTAPAVSRQRASRRALRHGRARLCSTNGPTSNATASGRAPMAPPTW